MTNKEIGDLIKAERKSKDWSQMDLAVKSGISIRSVQYAEGGKSMTIITLRSILNKIGYQINITKIED